MKRILSILLCVSLIMSICPIQTFAVEDNSTQVEQPTDETNSVGEVGGFLAGSIKTAIRLYDERKFTIPKGGHGFAAERANNLIDRLHGLNATVVGDNNVANGPDRKIINRDGSITWIQDKYYSTATDSVNAAFDDATGQYRYFDGDGNPMKLEVPSDQYDDAVKLMRQKIEQGLVKNVTNPDEAVNIVKQGNLTHKQALNIAKAGTVESLKYDAANGVITSGFAAGITFAIDYACCLLNGLDQKAALTNASLSGLKTGGVVFATYVISSQIAKTGVANVFVPTAEAIAKSLGRDVCEAILTGAGIRTAGLSAAQITANVAKVLSNNLVVDAVLIVVLTLPAVIDLFRGRISKEELLKNLTVTIISVAAGSAGAVGGAALGSLIAPGAGTYIGLIAGSALGGGSAAFLGEKVISRFYKSDADQMYDIISNEFLCLCDEYLISNEEGNQLAESLSSVLTGDVLKDMYAYKSKTAEDRTEFARNLIEPLFENQVNSRNKIELPTEAALRYDLINTMHGIVFVH